MGAVTVATEADCDLKEEPSNTFTPSASMSAHEEIWPCLGPRLRTSWRHDILVQIASQDYVDSPTLTGFFSKTESSAAHPGRLKRGVSTAWAHGTERVDNRSILVTAPSNSQVNRANVPSIAK